MGIDAGAVNPPPDQDEARGQCDQRKERGRGDQPAEWYGNQEQPAAFNAASYDLAET